MSSLHGGKSTISGAFTNGNMRQSAPPRYENVQEIGKGAYSAVYKGRDRLTEGRFVAMKEVRIPLNSEEGIPMTTVREIGLLRQLDKFEHPNIVRYDWSAPFCGIWNFEQKWRVMFWSILKPTLQTLCFLLSFSYAVNILNNWSRLSRSKEASLIEMLCVLAISSVEPDRYFSLVSYHYLFYSIPSHELLTTINAVLCVSVLVFCRALCGLCGVLCPWFDFWFRLCIHILCLFILYASPHPFFFTFSLLISYLTCLFLWE